MAQAANQLPPSFELEASTVTKDGEAEGQGATNGGYANVYPGRWKKPGVVRMPRVAIKELKSHAATKKTVRLVKPDARISSPDLKFCW